MSRSVAQSIAQRTGNVRNVQVIVNNVPPPLIKDVQGSKQSQLNCRAGLVLATPLTGQQVQVQGVQVPLIGKILLKACISRGNNKDSKTFTLRNINISVLLRSYDALYSCS